MTTVAPPPVNAPVTAIVVDDEPLSLSLMAAILSDIDGVNVTATCASGEEAASFLAEHDVDAAFIDVQMPGINGFELIRRTPADTMPLFTFVSAFSQYAVDAFEVHAVDYLLKPVSESRVKQSIERIRAQMQSNFHPGETKGDILNALNVAAGKVAVDMAQQQTVAGATTLSFQNKGRTTYLTKTLIDWVESAGDYVLIHEGGMPHLIRTTMKDIEQKLADDGFIRVHRSTIVNLSRIKCLHSQNHGDAVAELVDGTKVKVSRKFREHLEQQLT